MIVVNVCVCERERERRRINECVCGCVYECVQKERKRVINAHVSVCVCFTIKCNYA